MVSEGELRRALAAGIPPAKIVFSGVGKTAPRDGLRARSRDSLLQRRVRAGARAAVGAGRRRRQRRRRSRSASTPTSTPAPTARSPPARRRTSSASPGSAPARSTPAPRSCRGCSVVGIDSHIGSQITELQPFDDAFALIWPSWSARCRPTAMRIEHLDLGGGLGIPYRDRQRAAAAPRAPMRPSSTRHVAKLGLQACSSSPGRLIAGNAGILVAEVIYVKEGDGRNFLIVDAAMNDLVRPTLYDAFHDIRPVVQPPPDAPRSAPTSSGRSARRGDFLGLDRALPRLGAGRSRRLCDRRRLRRGAGRHLQFPAAGARGAGRGRPLRRRAPPPDL